MKLIIILAAIALTHGAKLERAYLPPSNARTAGGSGNFLQAPISGVPGIPGASNIPRNTYQSSQPGFSQAGTDYSQSGTGFPQSGNGFTQSGNGFSQSGDDYTQSGAYNNVNYNFGAGARPERPRAALERTAAILRQANSNDGETFSYGYETENGIYAEESGVATNGVEAQGGYSYTGDDGQVYSVRYTADQNGFVPQGDHLPTPPPIPEEILKALEQNARDEAAGIYDDGSYNEGKYAAPASNYNGQFNYQQSSAFNGNDDDSVVTNSALARSGNIPSYNRNANTGVSTTYGAPNTQNVPTRSFNAVNAITKTYGAPNAPTFNNAINRNAPAFNAPVGNAPSFNAPVAGNAPAYNAPNAGITRNSAAEKAYLPPFAEQRGQSRNTFGRRQQSFNPRTGYNY